jgi:hypothetical protein
MKLAVAIEKEFIAKDWVVDTEGDLTKENPGFTDALTKKENPKTNAILDHSSFLLGSYQQLRFQHSIYLEKVIRIYAAGTQR